MDFIDEKDIAFVEVRQQTGKVAGFFDGGAAGAFDVGAHGLGDDVRQRRFAEARRPAEQDVIDGFAALLCSLHGDFKPLPDLGLTGELRENGRAQSHLQRRVGLGQDIRNEALGHRSNDGSRASSRQVQSPALPVMNFLQKETKVTKEGTEE